MTCCREEDNDPFVMSLVDRIQINILTLQQERSRLKVKKIFPLLRKDRDSLPEKLGFPSGGLKAQLSPLGNGRQSNAGVGAGLPR